MEQMELLQIEARFVRIGDIIEGHEVLDRQTYLTAFVGHTVEFKFAERTPLTVKTTTELEVYRAV